MKRLTLTVVLAALLCSGCQPSGTDAVKFANQRIAELKSQKRQVIQADHGKWYCEAIEIRNANPGFKEDRRMQAWVSYEFRTLRSAQFDTEAQARDADLSPVNQSWQSNEELFIFKDGKWESSNENN